MKKKLLLAICLMASLAGYGQSVEYDSSTKTMTITNSVEGQLKTQVTSYLTEAGFTLEDLKSTHSWINIADDPEQPDLEVWDVAWGDAPFPIETLIVHGKLNGTDIKFIADLSRRKWFDFSIDPQTKNDAFLLKYGCLKHLDISDTQILAGGIYFDETLNSNTNINAFQGYNAGGWSKESTVDNEIGDMMFYGCDMLESIELPQTTTRIGVRAFFAMNAMPEIILPASVIEIANDAIECCYDIEHADYDPVAGKWVINRLKVILPDADTPIPLNDKSLYMGEDMVAGEQLAHIQTSVSLLDDYALNEYLKKNYEGGEVKGVATPPNKYWTFSSGVDVFIPDNVKVYTCQIVNGEADINEITDDLIVDEKRVIKRNNGVLVACPDNAESNAYELVAKYNADLVGTTPATDNANDYSNNSLVPVIKKAHYNPGDYYMLYHGKWVVLASDAEQVPAGKALLKK
jgi:hypothetical protein